MAVTAALATPVIGASATSVTTASFSPVVGTLLVAFGCARQAAAQIPTISDTLGGTWTAIPSSGIDSTVVAAQLWTHVVTVSTARTVTVASTSATQVAVGIVAVTGGDNTNFTNFASNINAAGDPSLTLSAFQTNSIGLGFLVSNAGAAASTPPSGYAELNDSVPITNLKTSIVYDATAPGTTLAWVSTGTDSIGYGLEIREAGLTAYTLPAVAGSYALTGVDATLTKSGGAIAYTLPADAGSYALTGQAVSLELGREVLAVAGAYGLSGAAAALERGREVLAVAGSYALTGQAASLERGREVLAVAGAYGLAGQPATFRRARKAVVVSGAYTLTGVPVNLLKPGAFAISALPGAYTLAGAAVSLERGREVAANSGSYALTGYAALLEKESVGGDTVGVWNGSAWVQKPVKVWSGSAWVSKPVKVWNGSAWV